MKLDIKNMQIARRLWIMVLTLAFASVTGLATDTVYGQNADSYYTDSYYTDSYNTDSYNANSNNPDAYSNDSGSSSQSVFEDVALELQKNVHDVFRDREEQNGIQRDPEERQKAIDAMPEEMRSVLPKLIYYPIAVIIAVAVVFLALVYGFMRNLHPSWSWDGRAVWYFITILYLGFFSCLICYGLLYDPSRYVDAWLGGGLFYLPFALTSGWFTLTPAEQVRDAIQDATADPDTGLFIMMARPIIRLVVICAIGGFALHLSFWWRSIYFLFVSMFPPSNS